MASRTPKPTRRIVLLEPQIDAFMQFLKRIAAAKVGTETHAGLVEMFVAFVRGVLGAMSDELSPDERYGGSQLKRTHVQHHVKRGVKNPKCALCRESAE